MRLFIHVMAVVLLGLAAQAQERADAPCADPKPAPEAQAPKPPLPLPPGSEVIRFAWRPPDGPYLSYNLDEPEDQHRIVLFSGVIKGGKYPVVAGFHGTYKKGKPPREYKFLRTVPGYVGDLVASGEIRPVVLVLPAFRFEWQNWPGFDLVKFKAKVEKILEEKGISTSYWVLFGHSGAAGCGGDGLNHAHTISPKVVGFFDTCLGGGWRKQIQELRKRKLAAVNIHSVETAGFRPRQTPEYQHWFDFGRAYEPMGLKPVKCPEHTPGEKLRDQKFRCAATPDGLIKGFVVDTGEGPEAHSAAVPVGIRYLLKEYVGKK